MKISYCGTWFSLLLLSSWNICWDLGCRVVDSLSSPAYISTGTDISNIEAQSLQSLSQTLIDPEQGGPSNGGLTLLGRWVKNYWCSCSFCILCGWSMLELSGRAGLWGYACFNTHTILTKMVISFICWFILILAYCILLDHILKYSHLDPYFQETWVAWT